MVDVVSLGETCVDLVGIVNTMPKENTKKDISSFKQIIGGSAANAIITVSNLGLNTSFIGKIGNDIYGKFIKNKFKKIGISVDNIKEDLIFTPYHFVVIAKKNQSRTIFKRKNRKEVLDKLSEFDKFTIGKSRAILMDRKSEKVGLEAVEIAKKNNVLISFDPSDKYNNYIDKIIKKTDILIVPHGFIKNLKNKTNVHKALIELWNRNKSIVVITLGPKGCIATNGKETIESPRYGRTKIVDTNGAGDVFHGAFLYAIIRRWPLEKSCKFANKIAALKCSIIGNELNKLNLVKFTKNK